MEILTVILLSGVLLLLVIILLRKSPDTHAEFSSSLQMMHQQVESLRNDMRAGMQHVTSNLNQQLNGVVNQLQTQTASVGDRLDSATRVIGDVQRNLGELGKATQEIKELGQGVTKLEELLRAPKLRGGLGELLLENLLKQVLPSTGYEIQHKFKNGQTVDAIIRTAERIVCVDSKFPLENFRKLHSASTDAERKQYRKTFYSDVNKHIDAIAGKYILPEEGTFPFALMYIPAENIYYEVIIKGNEEGGDELYTYAIEKRVIPVSPNSFYAYLQVIALGLRGLQIEQSAQQLLSSLTHLRGDMENLSDTFEVLGTHLNNARNKYDEAEKRLDSFGRRLDGLTDRSILDGKREQTLQVL